jgi:hypothetical protein
MTRRSTSPELDQPPPKHAPGPEHEALQIFVGTWNTEGEIEATSTEPGSRLKARDTYEWLPGGFFLLHRVEGCMGTTDVQSLEIIGYDATSRRYFTHSFDNYGVASAYQALLADDSWTILGDSERFLGRFNDDGTALSGTWERLADDSTWIPWMTITLTKAT